MSGNELMIPNEVRQDIEARRAWAATLLITNDREREDAMMVVREVKGLISGIEERLAASVKSAHSAWKEAVALRDGFLAGPQEVEQKVKAAVLAYDRAVEAERAKEQARLQALADEQARRERERLEKEAARLKTPELREARLAEAAMVTAPAVYLPPPAKTVGESTASVWKASVKDRLAAIKGIAAAGRWELLEVSQTALNALARASKGMVKIEGVEWIEEKQLRVRK